jgi:diguanylate cyclase (GGDEF)-like protein/PAS domain S-box-containing protein
VVLTIIPSEVVEQQHNEINKITTYLILITGICVSILTFSIIFITDRNKKEIRKKNMEMARITRHMPGGAKRSLVDEGYTLLECTDGFLDLTGYTRQELETLFDNQFLNMIYEQDRQDTKIVIENQRRSSNHIEVEYRMRRKDGKLIWIMDKGQLTIDEYGRQNFYCVLLDITTQKEAQLQLEYEREKYKTVLEISEDILFEYDIEKDELVYSDKYRKMFGRNPVISHCSQNLCTINGINEQDCPKVIEFFHEIISGNTTALVEVRIKDEQGEDIWFRAQAIVIKDKFSPVRIIGKLSNIDLQKREKEKLIKKARRDSLTNIYNKVTTEQEIKDYIDGSGKDSTHAFMIIDVDDFKGINDKLGHIVGDETLRIISDKLKKMFRTSDIVGRIGGDEFVVFAKDITSEQMAFEKAEAICSIFRDTYVGENKEYKVSGSVGITIYPKDGLSYQELYKKADIALYHVKGKGKDNYTLYQEQWEQ